MLVRGCVARARAIMCCLGSKAVQRPALPESPSVRRHFHYATHPMMREEAINLVEGERKDVAQNVDEYWAADFKEYEDDEDEDASKENNIPDREIFEPVLRYSLIIIIIIIALLRSAQPDVTLLKR